MVVYIVKDGDTITLHLGPNCVVVKALITLKNNNRLQINFYIK